MRDRAAPILLALLLALAGCRSLGAGAKAEHDDPERTARAFLYALYANDRAGYEARIVPEPDSASLIGSQTFTEAELAALRNEIDALGLRQASPFALVGETVWGFPHRLPVGTKTVYSTQYRGQNLAIPMLRTQAGWKVDVRFWLAMLRERGTLPDPSSPEMMAKGFLFHVLARKPEELQAFSAEEIDGEDYTSANDLPEGDLDQVLSLCFEMPVVKARPGERVRLPSGRVVSGGGERSDELVLIGLMGGVEVPFLLHRIDDTWRVAPQHYFEWMRQAGGL